MKYLLQFIIGSCIFVTVPYYNFVYFKIKQNKLDMDYHFYTLIMPFVSGLWNVLGKYLQDIYKYSDLTRYIVISTISCLTLFISIFYSKLYNYSKNEWINHIITVGIFYYFTYIVITNIIEKLVLNKTFDKNEEITIIILTLLTIFTVIKN
tara:strand:+ start:9905 stop:10357 length:453 start_codon:yes stop_codon:yes gene_type:complete